MMAELLGLDGGFPDLDQGPFPAEELQAIARLRDDTEQLRLKFDPPGDGIELPEDREARERIEEEFRQELEALLSSEQLAEYHLRYSEEAGQLRLDLAAVDATETEFRALLELGEKAGEAEMRELLGEERFRQVERNRNWDYQQLLRLAHRLDISQEEANRAHDLNMRVIEDRNRLTDRRAAGELSAADFRDALNEMGTELRGELREILGDQGLEHYPLYGGSVLVSFPEDSSP